MKTNGAPPVRGYLFNLIVYSHEGRRHAHFKKIVHEFIEKYPCRLIYIQADRDTGDDFLSASAVAPINQSHPCDQITIAVSKSRLDDVPFIVLPNLIPDLPVYLVWGQDPTKEGASLRNLEKMASRLVFDAECADDLQEFAQKLSAKIEKLKIDFMDVNWAQISGWRDVIAQTFNSAEKLSYLRHINRIQIKMNMQPDDPLITHFALQAIYLQAWMASKMDWEPRSVELAGDTIVVNYATLTVSIEPQSRKSLGQGQIFEVSFCSPEKVSTTLTHFEKQSKVAVYISTQERCELPFSLSMPNFQSGLTAMKEVFYYRCSAHYQDMLKVLAKTHWEKF